MGKTTPRNDTNAASARSGGEDIVFIDGERIEIACTYPDVESAIAALHRGD